MCNVCGFLLVLTSSVAVPFCAGSRRAALAWLVAMRLLITVAGPSLTVFVPKQRPHAWGQFHCVEGGDRKRDAS